MTHILQIRDGAAKKHRLYDVATKLVKDTKCSVTVPLCGKLALLVRDFELLRSFRLWHIGKQRKLYLEESSSKYWDRVDHYLEVIRQRADGDAVKIATYVTRSSRSVLVLIMASVFSRI
jgi:hypothetical protein